MGLTSYRIPQLECGKRPGSEAIFNSNSQNDICTTIEQWGISRILLVHSKSLAAGSNFVDTLKTVLGDRLKDTKNGVGSHSPYTDIIDIANRVNQHHVDCIISVGSGSYSDACKIARLMHASLPPSFGESDMEALVDPAKGVNPEDGRLKKATDLKLILVPTSLSAGEWNWAGSCTNSKGKKQHFALQDGCAPDLILMDPWLARTTPEHLWLCSGVRAIDHCIEILCNPLSNSHPDAQNWCKEALSQLVHGLHEYKSGIRTSNTDTLVEGISKCQVGSRLALMGLIIYRISVGPSHAIGHQLGSVGKVTHGITSCILLPHVLRYTKDATKTAQEEIVTIFNKTLGWSECEAADCVWKLVNLLGLPQSLHDVGVTDPAAVQTIVDHTMSDIVVSLGTFPPKTTIAKIVDSAR